MVVDEDIDVDGWEADMLDSTLSCVDRRWRFGDRKPFTGGFGVSEGRASSGWVSGSRDRFRPLTAAS